MLVELFGIPGAGKTTLVNAAAKRSRVVTRHELSAIWNGRSRLERAVHLIRSYLRPIAAIRAATFAFDARLTRAESFRRFARLLPKADWLRAQHGMILLDQGPLQELWSTLYASDCLHPEEAELSSLIASIYSGLDTLVMFIELNPQVASARIARRSHGHSRFDELEDAELGAGIARGAQLAQRISEAARRAGLRVETLDGAAPIEVLVNALVASVTE
jgi:thymidylate kinase